jgi:AcrR family transcriptional regulator
LNPRTPKLRRATPPRRRLPDDRTSRAIIRDEALRLFAERGADGVTVRQIAAAAHVSPSLILRHFGSKDGLREEVDRHVLRVFEAMLAETTAADAPALFDPAATGSLVEMLVRHLPASSPIPSYLRRLLLEPGKAGRQLFRRIFAAGQAAIKALVAAGLAAPGADPVVRAAFLTANDLAMLLLREQLAELLGVDPLSKDGMVRWVAEMLSVYASGLASAGKRQRNKR